MDDMDDDMQAYHHVPHTKCNP